MVLQYICIDGLYDFGLDIIYEMECSALVDVRFFKRLSVCGVCPSCGRLFLKRDHQYRKFCNDICLARFRAPHRVRVCVYCGKEFLTDFVQQKFCTRTCYDKESRERKKVKTPDPVKCVLCGKEFIPRSKVHKYCSKEFRDIIGKLKKMEIRKKERNK